MDLLYNDELTLGKIFGKQREAQALVDGWKKTLNALPRPPQGVQPLKVFVYDSGEDKPFTSGRYAMPTAIIEAAGGQNVMDGLEISWGTTSWESVGTRLYYSSRLSDRKRRRRAAPLPRKSSVNEADPGGETPALSEAAVC